MGAVMQWLSENWGTVAFAAFVLVNLINAFTRHFTLSDGWKRWALFAVEMLSVLTSLDADELVKMPLRSAPPPPKGDS